MSTVDSRRPRDASQIFMDRSAVPPPVQKSRFHGAFGAPDALIDFHTCRHPSRGGRGDEATTPALSPRRRGPGAPGRRRRASTRTRRARRCRCRPSPARRRPATSAGRRPLACEPSTEPPSCAAKRVPVRRERRVDGAGLRRSRVGRYAIAAIARIETLNHTCCCASMSFHRVGIVSKCAYAPRPSSSRSGLLEDWPPPHGLLAARAALPVQHAATTASPSIALRSSVQCSVRGAIIDAICDSQFDSCAVQMLSMGVRCG